MLLASVQFILAIGVNKSILTCYNKSENYDKFKKGDLWNQNEHKQFKNLITGLRA